MLELAKQLGSVSQAVPDHGVFPRQFLSVQEILFTKKVVKQRSIEMSRRVPNPKNRVAETVERRILELAVEQPAWGHTRMANELAKEGFRVSPTGVRGVWVRHDLNTMAKRLKASGGQDGAGWPDPDRKPTRRSGEGEGRQGQAHGEFDSACPGYCGAQDTFYVGTLKGVGRIYQQTFVEHLRQGRLHQALRRQDRDHRRRSAQ